MLLRQHALTKSSLLMLHTMTTSACACCPVRVFLQLQPGRPLLISAVCFASCLAVVSCCFVQAWQISEKLGLIGPACEQPEYNMFARIKVEDEFKPLYERCACAQLRGCISPCAASCTCLISTRSLVLLAAVALSAPL